MKLEYKIKLSIFTFLLSAQNLLGIVDPNNGVYVSGSNMIERVEGSYILKGNTEESNGGEIPINQVAVIKNNGTLDNWGTLKSEDQTYRSDLIVIIGGGVANQLIKTDNLITASNGKLINNSQIEMGTTYHKVHTYRILGLGGFYRFSNYVKNVIVASDSEIENKGVIQNKGDKFKISDDLGVVQLLTRTKVEQEKNVLNLTNSFVNNSGYIQAGRDYNPEDVGFLNINLLDLGLEYIRNVSAIKATGGEINNNSSGTIFVGGDIFKESALGGVNVDAIGADLLGTHNKYGVKLTNGVLNNSGKIIVEKDYTYGEVDGKIVEISLIFNGSFLGVGVLDFDNMKEYSYGVDLNSSTFNNNGGTISVGANANLDGSLLLNDSAATAIRANNSIINFNSGEIELDGLNVFLGDLTAGSIMTFRGNTKVSYKLKDTNDYQVNKDIFKNDSTSYYYIKGKLTINGDLTIGADDNVIIGLAENPIPDENGNYQVIGDESLGQIIVNENFNGESNLKYEASSLVGKDLNDYIGNSVLIADSIIGETGLNSDSYLFNISGEKIENDGKEEIVISDITRKNFNDIVTNNQLATIFETSYDNANAEQLEVYKVLAQGSDAQEFSQIVDEVTGKDTLVTLNSQVYDITKDLNKQFKVFAKTNIGDGIVFKYINSKSELGSNSTTVGFERKSSGVMLGYNKYVSEKLRLGAGFSYMKSDIDYTSASSNDVTTWNLRGYSDYNLNFANLFADLSFGYNQSENKRIAEQTSYTGLKEGDLDIYTVSLNNSLYKNYQINDKLIVMPSLNLDFTYLYQEDFEEKGNIGASADSTEAFYITAGIEIDAKYNLLSFDNSKINLIAGMDYSYDIVSENEDMNLKVSAFDPYYKEVIRELDKKSITYNLGLNYEYKDNYSVGVRYSKELINDVDNDQFGVDFTYKF